MRLWSSGKMPTTSMRRPTAPLKRSSGFAERAGESQRLRAASAAWELHDER
jgi:hypothetical protein